MLFTARRVLHGTGADSQRVERAPAEGVGGEAPPPKSSWTHLARPLRAAIRSRWPARAGCAGGGMPCGGGRERLRPCPCADGVRVARRSGPFCRACRWRARSSHRLAELALLRELASFTRALRVFVAQPSAFLETCDHGEHMESVSSSMCEAKPSATSEGVGSGGSVGERRRNAAASEARWSAWSGEERREGAA